jgi:hypothetical protein
MLFNSGWKQWIKRFSKKKKNNNNNDADEQVAEKLEDVTSRRSSSTELPLRPKSLLTKKGNNNTTYYNDDDTIMLYPADQYGSYFVLGKQNPNNLKNFTTDSHGVFVQKKERNIQYWNVISGEITYRSTGERTKSCRLNMFPSTTKQANGWKAAMKTGFIGNEKDLKNQELTVIIRVNKRVGHKTACCIKMRGGGHHNYSPDQAACIQLEVSTRDSGHAAARWAKELSHPLYEYQELQPFFGFFVEEGTWFGMKTTSWNNKDNNTTTNRCYIDPDPFNSDGTLRNDYRLYSEYIDKGYGNRYPGIVVNWAGGVPATVRVDGFENVDFYACNAREIIHTPVD